MHSRASLAHDLRALGLAPGDTVMVHASVRSVGEVAGGPDGIHLAIKDAIGAEGTLLMYASCPRHYDEVGRGNLTPEEEAEVLEKLPPFDAETARSARDNGALVELLRTYPGSRVNHHVARFVARGRHVDRLFATQPWDYALGRGAGALRRVRWKDPPARLRSRRGHLPALRRAHRRPARVHGDALSRAGAR